MIADINRSEFEQDNAMLERRLWLAVIVQAVEDWRSTNMRRRNEAEAFFFHSRNDFASVCAKAGISEGSLLPRLQRLKSSLPPQPQAFTKLSWAAVSAC